MFLMDINGYSICYYLLGKKEVVCVLESGGFCLMVRVRIVSNERGLKYRLDRG